MRSIPTHALAALTLLLVACDSGDTRNATDTPDTSAAPTTLPEPTALVDGADSIFINGSILTMDDANPSAQAIAIRGNTVLAVGSNDEVLTHRGQDTMVIDLAGLTVTPGFIDAHQHRIGDRGKLGYTDAAPVVQLAIEQGWTTINELYVDEARLSELRDLDESGVLRLRVNAYLPVMENSPEGTLFDEWYAEYEPGEVVSPHVRVAGLKVFTDFDNATVLLWEQDDLNAFLLKEYRNGWQLAVKTVSTRSLDMILAAFEYVEAAEPGVVNARARLEHVLFLTPEQIARVKRLGLVPIVNLNNPGQLVGDVDVDALIAREPQGSYAPWRSLEEAGIPVANGTGWPSYFVDEPTGAPFGSPMHLIYQAVTRVGNLGVQPYPWLLDQTITPEQALRSLTIDAAYSSFEEDVKGSLAAGKLADMVILSDNPLTVSTPEVNNIEVLMTMIDGTAESCAEGHGDLCPTLEPVSPPIVDAVDLTTDAMLTSSAALADSPASNVADGDVDTAWNSGGAPRQWVRFEFDTPQSISGIRLTVAQDPEGYTVHRIWGGDSEETVQLLHEFADSTADGQTLEFRFAESVENIRVLYVITIESPSWVAWREIEILGT